MPDSPTEERIAVWPCDHSNVVVEPGPAKPGYTCHTCGAVATTYVPASQVEALQAEVERLREKWLGALREIGEADGLRGLQTLQLAAARILEAEDGALSPQPGERSK